MKKILLTTLVACALVGSALAQGTVTFQSGVGTIKYMDGATAKSVPAGNPAQIPGQGGGKLNIALYAAAPNTPLSLVGGIPDLSGWLIASPIINQIAPLAGGVPGKTISIPASLSGNDGGLPVQLEVVAWAGDYTTFSAAAAAGAMLAWAGDAKSGGLLSWNQPTGTAQTAGVIPNGVFNGLVLAPIPEPSTFALAGLGAAALLIFRRRK